MTMQTIECTRNIHQCALKELIEELAMNRDEDRERVNRETWEDMIDEATMNGDEFYDYDGPVTTWN